jgi:hypothetical protein
MTLTSPGRHPGKMRLRGVLVKTILSKIFRTAMLGFGLGLCLLAGCAKKENAKSATGGSAVPAPRSASQSVSAPLPRGITGLELDMTLEQVGQLFTVKKHEHPLTALLAKYLKLEIPGKEKRIPRQYFLISPGKAKLPEGVMWADIRTSRDKVYRIGLHYEEASVERIGWNGITSPYLAKYGKPSQASGSEYTWTDERTRLDIESTGPTITVYFADNALETDMKKLDKSKFELPRRP